MANDEDDEESADEVREYIHDMLSQLATLARSVGERFLADGLLMLLKEAKVSPSPQAN